MVDKWYAERRPGDPSALERLSLLNEAFAALSDPQKRSDYEMRREQSATNETAEVERLKVSAIFSQAFATSTPPLFTASSLEDGTGQEAKKFGWLSLTIIVVMIGFPLGLCVWIAGPWAVAQAYVVAITKAFCLSLFLIGVGALVKWLSKNNGQGISGTPAIGNTDIPSCEAKLVKDSVSSSLSAGQLLGANRGIPIFDSGNESSPPPNEPTKISDSSLWLVLIVSAVIAMILFAFFWTTHPSNESTPVQQQQDSTSVEHVFDLDVLFSGKRGYDEPTSDLDYDYIIRRENEFIRLNPADVHAYHIRGFAWLGKDNYDEAIKDFSTAIRHNPDPAFSYINRGIAWNDKKDFDKAISDYDEAIRLAPEYAYAYSRRANAWSDKKDYAKAIRDYEQAIRLDSQIRFEDHINLAWLLATCPVEKFRDGVRAIQFAKKACEQSNWKSGCALNALAAAYAEFGQFDEAVRYQSKALEDPAYQGPAGVDFRVRLSLYKYNKPYRGLVLHQHPMGRQAPFR